MGAVCSPKELLEIGGVLRCARTVKSYVAEDEKPTVLNPLFRALTPTNIWRTAFSRGHSLRGRNCGHRQSPTGGHPAAYAHPVRENPGQPAKKVISSPAYSKFLREPIITIRQGRYVVPVKSECKNDVPGLVHDVSATGSTYFVEPMSAVNANNALRELELKGKKEIERILAELSAEAAGHRDDITADFHYLVKLDVIFAKGKAGLPDAGLGTHYDTRQNRPAQARHPLIDPQKVVPVSLRLGSDFDTMIITGPTPADRDAENRGPADADGPVRPPCACRGRQCAVYF